MCGVAGVLEFRGSRTPRPQRISEIERMISLLGHRGPDESGYLLDDVAALVSVRLSITDVEHGQQPMGDREERFFIVFNGEVYNHRALRADLEQRGHVFETLCDTEVALRAWVEWGEEAPAHFDGGFAFAIYNRRERVAYLVRDRFGKRPLFYCSRGDAFLFGSEIKVLLARQDLNLRWDTAGLAAIFAKWTPFGTETPFEGVRQVPAGTIMRISASETSQRPYAGFPVGVDPLEIDFEEASDHVGSLLRESVRLRLQSDVEVGILLSGGLDSTVIAQLARTLNPDRLRSFSISFADPRFDESADQVRVARAFGLNHASIKVSPGDIAEAFGEAIWHTEVPQFRTAFTPMFLMARFIREAGVKVVLSGEGADEVFLGYDIFKETRLRQAWRSLDPAERRQRVGRLYPYLPHFSDANVRSLEALYANSIGELASPLFSHELRLRNARFALRLLRTESTGLEGLNASIASLPGYDRLSSVRKGQWIEMHTLLQGYLLSSQGDRMMFAHGVESRCPFLSPSVVSYAARLPEEFLLSPEGDEKHLLKHAFRGVLPREILAKPKQPYRAPDASSFFLTMPDDQGRFVPWVEELLTDRQLREIEPLDGEQAARFITKLRQTPRELISPREDQAFLLLLSLSVLNRQFIHREGISMGTTRPPLARALDLGIKA